VAKQQLEELKGKVEKQNDIIKQLEQEKEDRDAEIEHMLEEQNIYHHEQTSQSQLYVQK